MTYQETHNEIIDLNISNAECLTFKSAVVIMYGISNYGIVSRQKIKRATGYPDKELDFIFHNLLANGIIKDFSWNLDIGSPETDFMELVLCAMAAAGEVIRSDIDDTLVDAEEKPIKWTDLYKQEYKPTRDLAKFEIQDQEDFIIMNAVVVGGASPVYFAPTEEPPKELAKMETETPYEFYIHPEVYR